MLRQFLILSSADPAALDGLVMQSQGATRVRQAVTEQGFAILVRSMDDLVPIPTGKGYVVGTLFSKHGPARCISSEDPHCLDELVHSDPVECLRDRFWGGYVALLVDGGALTLLRDPSGAMPCYRIPIAGGWAAASDVSLLVQAGLLKPEIAWKEMPRFLAARDLPASATAIENVRELLPGTYERIEAGKAKSNSFWSPWNYVGREWPGAEQMEEKLRRTVDHSVASWASTSGSLLLTLSGGFDSSVVAVALGIAKRQFSCLTISTGGGLGNERDYARAMAEGVGARLVEEGYDLADIDLSLSAARHFPKPIGQIHETAYHAKAMRVAGSLGADAIYTGYF